MADGILLSQDTFDRIMKVVSAYETGKIKGMRVVPGTGLRYEETTGNPDDQYEYIKIGVDGIECP